MYLFFYNQYVRLPRFYLLLCLGHPMKNFLFAFLSIFLATNIQADEVYTCTKNGSPTFQSTPCTQTDIKASRQKEDKRRQAEIELESRRPLLKVGMTERRVVMLWGEPDSITEVNTTWGTIQRWSYSKGRVVLFDDDSGRVLSIINPTIVR